MDKDDYTALIAVKESLDRYIDFFNRNQDSTVTKEYWTAFLSDLDMKQSALARILGKAGLPVLLKEAIAQLRKISGTPDYSATLKARMKLAAIISAMEQKFRSEWKADS